MTWICGLPECRAVRAGLSEIIVDGVKYVAMKARLEQLEIALATNAQERAFQAKESKLIDKIESLEAGAKDARYLVAALIKAAGGRVELSMHAVMSIGPKDQITTWDDPISGKKIYALTEVTTSDGGDEHG